MECKCQTKDCGTSCDCACPQCQELYESGMKCTCSTCDASCTCSCDDCQKRFEEGWKALAEKENLCMACGIPRELTLASLMKHQYTHFFDGCALCKPRMIELLEAEKICVNCRAPLTETQCKNCACDNDDACQCVQCRSSQSARAAR